ncbi:hypothetical protein STEG23_034146, partial [Scotinomys teguina]
PQLPFLPSCEPQDSDLLTEPNRAQCLLFWVMTLQRGRLLCLYPWLPPSSEPHVCRM